MFLKRFLKEEYIDTDLGAGIEIPEEIGPKSLDAIREHVIRKLADLLDRSGQITNVSKLVSDLLNRERRQSTAIGNRVAIPHVRTLQARTLAVAIGIAPGGLPFGASDGEHVSIFIALAAPPYDDKLYLKAYQNIGEVFSREGAREAILAAEAGELVRLMSEDVRPQESY